MTSNKPDFPFSSLQACLTISAVPQSFALQAAELDQQTFKGLWSVDQYHQELQRQSGIFLGLFEKQSKASSAEENGHVFYAPKINTDHLIGMACCWGILDEAHITLLGIDPGRQRQGLGHLLLNRLLFAASDRGLERATLEVRKSNAAALHLYDIHRFKSAGERPNYYSDGEAGVILWLGGLQKEQYKAFLVREWELRIDRMHRKGWIVREQMSFKPIGDTESRP